MIKELVKFEFKNYRSGLIDIAIYFLICFGVTIAYSKYGNIPYFYFFIILLPLVPGIIQKYDSKTFFEYILSKPLKRLHIVYAKTIKIIIITFLASIFVYMSLMFCNFSMQITVHGFEKVQKLGNSNNFIIIENQEQKNETEILKKSKTEILEKKDYSKFISKAAGYKRNIEVKKLQYKFLFGIVVFFLISSFCAESSMNRKSSCLYWVPFMFLAYFIYPIFLLIISLFCLKDFIFDPIAFYMDNFSMIALIMGGLCVGAWFTMKNVFQKLEIK